ncbi:MAG: asparagine synthase-related protein [Ignavibacteria bacterium]
MGAIAGVSLPDRGELVSSMLTKMKHRWNKIEVFSTSHSTLGVSVNTAENSIRENPTNKYKVIDELLPGEHYAKAEEIDGTINLNRDFAGVVPIYFGYDEENNLYFASEVKGLMGFVKNVRPVPPGGVIVKGKVKKLLDIFRTLKYNQEDIEQIKSRLYSLLEDSIRKCITNEKPIGILLSRGLDSSTIVAFARKFTDKIYGFSCGFAGASDLEYSKRLAKEFEITYYPIKAEINEVVKILPQVIYHLESFDARLIRSSLIHYLAVRKAAEYVEAILSGEGADELFAGYYYLQKLTYKKLEKELQLIFYNLHNTALQRVDRCSAAFGVRTYVPFLCREVVDYVKNISPQLKIKNKTEKWILKETLKHILPIYIIKRPKQKLWQGSGVENKLEYYCNEIIKDEDFRKNRVLKNGWEINSKEEYYYYKIFQELFSSFDDYNWIGRTDINKP